MARPSRRALSSVLLPVAFTAVAHAQKPLTWEDVREQFRANNPSLQAGQTFVQENRANEVTAGLRPNPQLSIIEDEFHVWNPNPLQPFQNAQLTHTVTSSGSGSISGNCGWQAPNSPPPSPPPTLRTWSGICYSPCGMRSFACSRQNLSNSSPATILPTTTKSSRSIASATRQATSPGPTSSAWSCSAPSSKAT